MRKVNWLKWFLYLVMLLLALEVLKAIVTKSTAPVTYLVAIVIICLQTLSILAFFYYAIFALLFRRRWTGRRFFVSFFTSFIGLLVLLEVVFSYWLYHPAQMPGTFRWAYKYYYDLYNFRIMQYEKNMIAFDKELLYTLKRNASFQFNNAEFETTVKTDSSGFRDDDSSTVAPDIICLGDSFTMGWGVEESQSFPKLLQYKTGKKVLNTGTPSYGTTRELMLLNRLDVSKLQYLIIQYCSNDIEENSSYINGNYKLGLTPQPVFESSMKTYEWSRVYFPGKNSLLTGQLWMKHQVNKLYPIFRLTGQPYNEEFDSREHAATFLKVLIKLRENFKNVRIIVTDIDVWKYRDNHFIDELGKQLELVQDDSKKNIILVNSMKVLTQSDYFILDYHINASGHKKVADELLRAIQQSP